MAIITSYGTLATAVSDYLERPDLAGFVPNFIQNCEQKLYKKMKIRGTEADFSVVIASSVAALPANYLSAKHLYISTSPSHPMGRMNLKNLLSQYPRGADTGLPDFYARQANNLIFGPAPDSNYTVAGVYYTKLTVLAIAQSGSSTNYFVDNAPELLLYGSLLEAEPFIKNDPRIAVWRSFYEEAYSTLEMDSDEEEVSGDAPFEVLM